MTRQRSYREALVEELRDNPDEERVYLEVCLEEYEKDQDGAALLLALRTVAEAQGGVAKLAAATDLRRQSIYKALSAKGNPRLSTIGAILRGLGYRLSLEPIEGP